MLEQLTMQEVSQIILSVPEGVEIPGKRTYYTGEPIMIINNPGLSNLSFISRPVKTEDGRGFIGQAGLTNEVKFTINEGSILYGLWSYIYGEEQNTSAQVLQGVEYITPENGKLYLGTLPKTLFLYEIEDNKTITINPDDYEVQYEDETNRYYIDYQDVKETSNYMASYTYQAVPDYITKMKQIHNNIFAAMDIYIDAVDKKNDDKYIVYIHCDKVQVDTDLIISVNNSQKASFTPIYINSVPVQDEVGSVNKDVATVMVIKNG